MAGGHAVGCVLGDVLVMGWLEVAACLPPGGEDIPAVQVARGTAGASGRQGDGEVQSSARCHQPCVAPFNVASGLSRPQEMRVKPALLKCSMALGLWPS